jgi:hypothetical protein
MMPPELVSQLHHTIGIGENMKKECQYCNKKATKTTVIEGFYPPNYWGEILPYEMTIHLCMYHGNDPPNHIELGRVERCN